jgi:hypothetical protein
MSRSITHPSQPVDRFAEECCICCCCWVHSCAKAAALLTNCCSVLFPTCSLPCTQTSLWMMCTDSSGTAQTTLPMCLTQLWLQLHQVLVRTLCMQHTSMAGGRAVYHLPWMLQTCAVHALCTVLQNCHTDRLVVSVADVIARTATISSVKRGHAV